MLSTKIKRIIIVFAIIIFIVLALFIGFRVGFSFITSQNERELAIEAMQKESQMQEVTQGTQGSAEPTPAYTDQNGNAYTMPRHVKQDTPNAVEVYIDSSMGISEIADLLKEKGVIADAMPFRVIAELNGFGGRFQRGTHFVLNGMDYNEIMYNLALPAETIWVTFPEGYSYVDIKRRLREVGVNFDEAEMDRLMNSPSSFTDYSFITGIPIDQPGRIFMLEGYLFPDTYQFDLNASEETIIRTFLRNLDLKLTAEIRDRADNMGMTLDQVLTMASVIQNESGVIQEDYLVSRVFHNRLDQGMLLQSCATTNYLRQLNGQPKVWAATAEDIASDSPYNTYRFEGLPPGAIGNPGLEAIKAALYPDLSEPNLLYFVAKGDGTNAFANTLAGHEANIEKYSGNWDTPRT